MNTTFKPCANRRCTQEDCGRVYREVGDTKIELAHPRPVAYDGQGPGKFKCPLHDDKGSRSD